MEFEFLKFSAQYEVLLQNQTSSFLVNEFFKNHFEKEGVYRFVVTKEQKAFAFIQIYSATEEGNGYWHTQELGNFGVDLFIGDETDQKPEMIKAIFDSFLTQVFKSRSLQEVSAHPEGNILSHLSLFFGADYRIEEMMMMKEGGALLLEVFWV